jgi:hypothetical protein
MTAVMVGRVGFDLPTDLHQQNMSGKAKPQFIELKLLRSGGADLEYCGLSADRR